MVVDRKIMQFFAQNYEGKVIPRNSYKLQDGSKKVDIYYKKVFWNFVIIFRKYKSKLSFKFKIFV